jgi:hypothetical protein
MLSIIIYVSTGIIAFMLGKSYGYNKCKVDLQRFIKVIESAKKTKSKEERKVNK